jgi:hypothetical protein
MERLGAINERLDQQERETAMADTMRSTEPSQPRAAPKLNLEGLPDPVSNPKEYGQVLAERTLTYKNEMDTFAQQKPQMLGDPDALWEDFQNEFPEYAENNNRIRFATSEVASRLAKRGVDVQKFMFTKPEQLFKLITDEYDHVFGSPVEEEEEVEAPAPRKRRAKQEVTEDDGDDGRTDVLGAGELPGAPGSKRQGPQPGLIEDLQAIQRKTGYF